MPEFFEVKKIKEYLTSSGVVQTSLEDIKVLNGGERLFKSPSFEVVRKRLRKSILTQIETKAKYTLLHFSKGILVWHYRFTGLPHIEGKTYDNKLQAIHSLPIDDYPKKYVRFQMQFTNHRLNFVDTRCLSHIHLYENEARIPLFQHLAPDLSSYTFPSFELWKQQPLINQKTIKTFLQDQTIPPSGIGNYLACEILFLAKMDPWKPVCEIRECEYINLVNAVKKVCELADQAVDYHWFYVYQRANCLICKNPILRKKHRTKNSQTTHFCAHCQR